MTLADLIDLLKHGRDQGPPRSFIVPRPYQETDLLNIPQRPKPVIQTINPPIPPLQGYKPSGSL